MYGDGQLGVLLLRRADQRGKRIGWIGHDAQIAEVLEPLGECRRILARQTVTQPDDIGVACQHEAIEPRQCSGPINRPGQGRQRVCHGTRIGGAQQRGRSRRLASGQRRRIEENDLAILALGAIDELPQHALACRPVMRGGPAIVDDQDERPAGRESRTRIEQRMGEGQDDQRGERHAQEDEPKWRARRRFLARHQSEKQPDRRESQLSRRRRRDPQEPP